MKEEEKEEKELRLIPKFEQYLSYGLLIVTKLPRIKRFNIGNEYKKVMYETLKEFYYSQKVGSAKWLYD